MVLYYLLDGGIDRILEHLLRAVDFGIPGSFVEPLQHPVEHDPTPEVNPGVACGHGHPPGLVESMDKPDDRSVPRSLVSEVIRKERVGFIVTSPGVDPLLADPKPGSRG